MKWIPLSFSACACLFCLTASVAFAQGQGQGRGGPGGPGGPGGRFGGGPQASPLMRALDTDGDGELSAKEIENASVALKTLDRDKDGKLTAAETRPAFGGRGMGAGGGSPEEVVTRMMAFDKNDDKKLSKDELPERMQAMMDRSDTNKDGFLDNAELTAFASQRGPGAGGGGGRPGGRGNGGPGAGGGRGNRNDQ
jgi:EF hand